MNTSHEFNWKTDGNGIDRCSLYTPGIPSVRPALFWMMSVVPGGKDSYTWHLYNADNRKTSEVATAKVDRDSFADPRAAARQMCQDEFLAQLEGKTA